MDSSLPLDDKAKADAPTRHPEANNVKPWDPGLNKNTSKELRVVTITSQPFFMTYY